MSIDQQLTPLSRSDSEFTEHLNVRQRGHQNAMNYFSSLMSKSQQSSF